MSKKEEFYADEFSQEIMDCFENLMYPEDVVRHYGGTRKDYEYIYRYWMDKKREKLQQDKKVACVLDFEGYEQEMVTGKIIKVLTNSVIVQIESEVKSTDLDSLLDGCVCVSIKRIMYI